MTDATLSTLNSGVLMEARELEKRFTYHPATGLQPGTYGAIRKECLRLATIIDALCPDSREKSIAITKLEEVMFWANASVARNTDEAYMEVRSEQSLV